MKYLNNIKLKIITVFISITTFLISIFIKFSTVIAHATGLNDPGSLPETTVSTQANFAGKFTEFNTLTKQGLSFFIAITLFTAILVLIYNFCKLGYVANNPNERQQVLRNLLITGGCLILVSSVGSVWVILCLYTI